jgi:hypothetical protein
MHDMSVTCSACAATSRSRRDLEFGQAASAHRYCCPNAGTLRELRGDDRLPGRVIA